MTPTPEAGRRPAGRLRSPGFPRHRRGPAAWTGAAAVALLAAALGCAPRAAPPGSAGPAAEREAPSDSLTVVIRNPNYLDAVVRLFAKGREIEAFRAGGLAVDTAYLQSWKLRGAHEIAAVAEPIGSPRRYDLGEYTVPAGAAVIQIQLGAVRPYDGDDLP